MLQSCSSVLCGTPNSGGRAVSHSSAGFREPIPHPGSPCPVSIHGEMTSLYCNLTCRVLRASMEGLPFLEQKQGSGLGVGTTGVLEEKEGGETAAGTQN